MTNDGGRLDYLDGWRGLAITFLLIGHFFPVPGVNLGAIGVGLFFVLSGLLMSRLLFIQKVPLRTFYQRRISRILPAAFFFIGAVVVTFVGTNKVVGWDEALAAALFVNNYFSWDTRDALMPFGHIWSLSVEEHSYILLALLALLVRKKILGAQRSVAITVVFCCAFSAYYFMRQDIDSSKWLRTEVAGYGIFLSAYLAVVFDKITLPKMPWLIYPLLLLGGIGFHWWSIPTPIRLIFGIGAFALAVNLLGAAPSLIQRILSIRLLRWLGLMSFSLYLWQQPFYLAMHWDGMNRVFAITLSFICGIASFYLVEQPARSFLNNYWKSRSVERMNRAAIKV